MSLSRPIPDEEIPFDYDKSEKSKVFVKKIEENDLEALSLRINFGI
jgi:hypothetical protein